MFVVQAQALVVVVAFEDYPDSCSLGTSCRQFRSSKLDVYQLRHMDAVLARARPPLGIFLHLS